MRLRNINFNRSAYYCPRCEEKLHDGNTILCKSVTIIIAKQ